MNLNVWLGLALWLFLFADSRASASASKRGDYGPKTTVEEFKEMYDGYDRAGRAAKMVSPNGQVTLNAYDMSGRLARAATPPAHA